MKNKLILALALTCLVGSAAYAAPVQGDEKLMKGMAAADIAVTKNVNALPAISIGSGTKILGPAEATQEQMVTYIKRHNPSPKLHCTVEQLVGYYYEEGSDEGVRPDVALCQALLETGFFAYGRDVDPVQNNYCGLGTTGKGQPGAYFATAQRGVRAHIQHLLGYATTRKPDKKLIDPRYDVLRQKYPRYYGHIPYWTGLNGKWALPGNNYGETILRYWHEAKNV